MSALGLNKARMVLFLWPHIPQNASCQLRRGSPFINPTSLPCFTDVGFDWDVTYTPLKDSAYSLRLAPPSLKRTPEVALIPSVMTQPKYDKVLSTLYLNKARTVLFLGAHTPQNVSCQWKYESPPYKPSISPVLCRCEICLGCYVHPFRDSTSSLRFAPPSLKRTCEAPLILFVMT